MNIKKIIVEDGKLDEDFVIISKLAMTNDHEFHYYEEGTEMTNVMGVVETHFEDGWVKHMYHIPNHKIDKKLAVTIGLGVTKEKETGMECLYNSDTSSVKEFWVENETLKINMYYQLTHPEYDNKELDQMLSTEEGETIFRSMFEIYDFEPLERLKKIFKSKKGGNNIVNLMNNKRK